MKKFVFTCGDINGIGPEIVVKTLNKIHNLKNSHYIFICPSNVFNEAIRLVKPRFNYEIVRKYNHSLVQTSVQVIDIGKVKITPGRSTSESGKISYKSIETAFELVDRKLADAMITAPISKTAFHLANIYFSGHTELLAKWAGSNDYVMMFLSKKINAALLTIHEPIRKIPELLTTQRLLRVIQIVSSSLVKDLNITRPKIAVLGLNPHAGEEGLIGTEEKKIIKPLLLTLKDKADGPFSPDAFFGSKKYKYYNLVLGMYHDQVLIPFKMMNFSSGVNFTAGLKIIRTSPDHGVAYDIAWKNLSDEKSLLEAYKYAKLISYNRKKNEKN